MNGISVSNHGKLTMKHLIVLIFLFAINPAAIASDPALAAPTATPAATETYGTPAGEPKCKLQWSVYQPAGSPPWPVVLVLHAGGFKAGSRNDDEVVVCAHDLADAGYLAFAVSYRLAPPGHLKGQTFYGDDGRYPKQTSDIQAAILAARADPRCNGQVGAVGGSAGASHAVVAAATGTTGADRLDVAVCLSGAYNFADFSGDIHNLVEKLVTNYTGSTDLTTLLNDSPISVVDNTISPLFLVNTEHDPQPLPQFNDMVAKLQAVGAVNFDSTVLAGNQHAFDYWPTVKTAAIHFLANGFAGRTSSLLSVP